MSRLSRGKKREQKQAAHAAAPAAAPIEVRVPGAGPGAGGASVGGVPVNAAPGEEIQQAVLNRLHRIALAGGHPVHATVHDERIGYVVPLQVDTDGSSRLTAEPVRTGPPQDAAPPPTDPPAPRPLEHSPAPPGVPPPVPPAGPAGSEPPRATRDEPTQVLRSAPQPARDAAPTFPLRAVPAQATPPGTVAPPTGEFGPPPLMDVRPAPDAVRKPEPVPDLDPDPKPTPARGFDAVAEAVLGDEPLAAPGEAPTLLAEPIARINEAVKAGRIETATRLAEEAVAEASGTLGPEHAEVLRLRELIAYIAYLGGDPVRAFRLSLALAGIHRRTGDGEAAYGNVQSAATAWRAVRDPVLGLELGGELIGLWTELTAEDGPAADDIEQLESARARMGRLTARARTRGD